MSDDPEFSRLLSVLEVRLVRRESADCLYGRGEAWQEAQENYLMAREAFLAYCRANRQLTTWEA